jgi:hypothetical protein
VNDITVVQIGSPTSPILVLIREYEGRRFIDVRRYYVDRATKETKPTKKGITLNARSLAEIHDVFDRSEKAISDWLERDGSMEPDAVKRQMLERQSAADKTARKAKPYNISSETWRSPGFFIVHQRRRYDERRIERQSRFCSKNAPPRRTKDVRSAYYGSRGDASGLSPQQVLV